MKIATMIFGSLFLCSLSGMVNAQEQSGSRNVILIIGDGMDDQHLTMARNYYYGPEGKLVLDGMFARSNSKVLTVSEQDPSAHVYVADSANSATAMATGIVTSRGRIATTAKTDEDIPTIIEMAHAQGFSTGIISTANVTDATPAAFVAHINVRGCENPSKMVDVESHGDLRFDCSQDLKSAGGLGSISEQIAGSDVDVVLGGGASQFGDTIEDGSMTVRELAVKNGYAVIDKIDANSTSKPEAKLLGLLADGHIPVVLRGEGGRVAEEPAPSWLYYLHHYLGEVVFPDTMVCEANPEFDGMPSLVLMTQTALDFLGRQGGSEKGFFLVIESASIDKQSHLRNPCGSIGEVQQLEESLTVALEFAQASKNTLIIVTADHGQAAQIVPDDSLFKEIGIPIFTPGQIARIETRSGEIMAINYATNNFNIEEHTGVDVPIFINDAGIDAMPTSIRQSEIFDLMVDFLNISVP